METEGQGHPSLGRHSPNHQAVLLPPPHRAGRVRKEPMENLPRVYSEGRHLYLVRSFRLVRLWKVCYFIRESRRKEAYRYDRSSHLNESSACGGKPRPPSTGVGHTCACHS